jgi:hypothetical protein
VTAVQDPGDRASLSALRFLRRETLSAPCWSVAALSCGAKNAKSCEPEGPQDRSKLGYVVALARMEEPEEYGAFIELVLEGHSLAFVRPHEDT